MFKTRIMTPFILVVWPAVIVVAASTAAGQDRVKLHKVAEVDTTGSVSSDGRFLSYTDWDVGDLFIRDLQTRENRNLTQKGWPGAPSASIISPDGKRVAYEWSNEDGFSDLRLINLDGSGLRVLYRNQAVPYIEPQDWSPNMKYIGATFKNKDGTAQIVLVSVSEGSVRVLKTLGRQAPLKMSFSLDGRFLVYDRPSRDDSPQRDIFVLSVDGQREFSLVKHPANDFLLELAPDGKRLLFASDRTGTLGVWAIQIADEKSRGEPELVKPDIGSIARGLGFAQDGSYYYGLYTWMSDVYVATLDSETGKIRGTRKLVRHVGFDTSVQWSPDGQYLAYASGRGWATDPFVLNVRSAATGHQRRFQLNMNRFGGHALQPHWSPDGRSLLAQGRDYTRPWRQGLFRIDGQTGEVTPLVQTETACPTDCIEWPVWSPDGKLMFTRWTKPWPGRTIVVRDLETGREKELYRAVSPAGVAHLAGSPDGQQLGFVWWDSEKGEAALKVVPTAGGELRELVKLPKPELSSYG